MQAVSDFPHKPWAVSCREGLRSCILHQMQ
jgi:hypothetical protein